MKPIAVFPGSFDPITMGHFDIIKRGIPLFSEIFVAIGTNSEKKYMFSLQQRMEWIEKTFEDYPTVKVENYSGLTVDYCKRKEANFLLRGLRNPGDFEFEKAIAHTNRSISDFPLETVFLLTSANKSFISSSIVRDVIRNHGDYTELVPQAVRI